MNSVIIPDENVRISTKGIHLDRDPLNTTVDDRIEIARREMATVIGLIDFIIFVVTIIDIAVMFPFILLIYKIIVSFELLGIILGLYFFLFGLFLLFLYSVHYVYILLMIELVLLGSFVFLFFSFFGVLGLYISFVFLLVVVCMGGFRISLLVSISRCYGRDF